MVGKDGSEPILESRVGLFEADLRKPVTSTCSTTMADDVSGRSRNFEVRHPPPGIFKNISSPKISSFSCHLPVLMKRKNG